MPLPEDWADVVEAAGSLGCDIWTTSSAVFGGLTLHLTYGPRDRSQYSGADECFDRQTEEAVEERMGIQL